MIAWTQAQVNTHYQIQSILASCSFDSFAVVPERVEKPLGGRSSDDRSGLSFRACTRATTAARIVDQ